MHRDKAFTLVEVLVVIAVIAMLMAILMPALQRVKRMAKAVVCQSNLRQWGLWFPMYTADNDGKFFGGRRPGGTIDDPTINWYGRSAPYWMQVMRPYYRDSNDVLLCPMAKKYKGDKGRWGGYYGGSKFSAWRGEGVRGSYGLNYHVRNDPDPPPTPWGWKLPPCWRTSLVKGADNIPVFLDCTVWRMRADGSTLTNLTGPPSQEGHDRPRSGGDIRSSCINRHDGYVNVLFMDWTVRRVGLKELWTLRWNPDFDTAGPWTRAGGVRPEKWPDWMRKFKDY